MFPRLFITFILLISILYFDVPLFFGRCDIVEMGHTSNGGGFYNSYTRYGFFGSEIIDGFCSLNILNVLSFLVVLIILYLFSTYLLVVINRRLLFSVSTLLLLSIIPLTPHKDFFLFYRGDDQLRYSEQFVLTTLLDAPVYFRTVPNSIQNEPHFKEKIEKNKQINSVFYLLYLSTAGYGSFLIGKRFSIYAKGKN